MKVVERFRRFSWRHEFLLAALLIVLLAVAGFVKPEFLNLRSQLLLSRHLWEFALLALPMTLIILSGGIDLSVGSALGMCAVAFGATYAASGSLVLSCLVCLLTGAAGGMINGWLISRLRIHPLIVTLATYAAFRGLAEGFSQGASYSQFGEGFSQLARGMWWGVPIPAFVFGLWAAACAAFLSWTPGGRYLAAMGYNEQAARFSGVAVDRIKFLLYTFSGLMAGLAAVIYVSRFDTAKADAGTGFELDVITAVVVGGTSIAGGRGNIGGTVLGLLLIHETRQFVSRQWQVEELKSIVIGLLLIGSLLLNRFWHVRSRG
ncbi:MAG: ABC transporter permease [Planctomycetaceae bacterium]|nr:ABC transporter permease [Planctomycetaceae bacterium]